MKIVPGFPILSETADEGTSIKRIISLSIILCLSIASSVPAAPASSFTVDISPMAAFYGTLPPDEKEEQVRDWALQALFPGTSVDTPVRYPALKGVPDYAVAPGRVAPVPGTENDCAVLVPDAKLADTFLVGRMVDDLVQRTGRRPDRVRLYGYALTDSSGSVTVTSVREIDGKEVFSNAFGYTEARIATAYDLRCFLAKIDDLTFASWEGGQLVLGGRKRADATEAAFGFDDAAALYQAYRAAAADETAGRSAYNRYLEQQYALVLKNNRGLREKINAGKVRRADVMKELRRRIPYRPSAPADIGFSLDPTVDTNGLAHDLRAMAANNPDIVPALPGLDVFISSRSAAIARTAGRVEKNGSVVPFVRFKQSFTADTDPVEMNFRALLQKIELDHTFQSARYDGNLKGTAVAMTLFYTDLTAKLWALDYNGLAPAGKITGFVPIADIKVPKLYWEDFVKYSKTRLWFGLRKDGFDIFGSRLCFAPVATRVYAASSDPLAPGKETTPNYQSERFLGWWDKHYERVAEFEPHYHKLNQIQKWSCLITVLAEVNNRSLDFLQSAPVDRSLDFRQWYAANARLRSKTSLPFADGTRLGCNNECLSIMSSAGYPLMGKRYFLSGGISLASRKDIVGKLKKAKQPAAGSKGSASSKTARRAEGRTAKTTTRQPSPPQVAAPQTQNPRAHVSGLGTLRSTADREKIVLSWQKGEAVVLNDLVRTLAAAQDARQPGFKDESLFKALPAVEQLVRLEAGRSYLLKTSALSGRWVFLSVNGNAAGFPAAASGTAPDADIFSAKCIPPAKALSLISEKHGIPLLPQH